VYFVLSGYTGKSVPKVGEFWAIEGITGMRFAPVVLVRSGVCHGMGIPPNPIRPAWDELINGSTDTQLIELQGVALDVQSNQMALLTHEGKVHLELFEIESNEFTGLENALIRIRGVVSPARDNAQQIVPAQLRLFNATVSIDEPPAEPFSAPLKHASDLLLFDARANALQRVRVTGQLVHEGHGQYYMMDGTNSLSFTPRTALTLQAGDLVEVEGFPDVSGPGPSLREATARRTGAAPLPAPRPWTADATASAKLHGTVVQVKATLTSVSADHMDSVLSLQAGGQGFVARLEQPQQLPDLKPGSLLELTGVCVQPSGNIEPEVNLFELLLNSPADIRVLDQPSWWTARRALSVVSLLLLVILAILVWVTQLRRQVEERTAQLAVEIRSREQAERQRLLEAERSRIAHDLHDDLGASLTQIRFLSAVKSIDPQVPEATRAHLEQVSEKSRQMVVSLDEIVWAVNPANDSLKNLAAYLSHVAREFFSSSEIDCRLEIDQNLPDLPLNSELRHNLYLVVREALNNTARHSRAAEVWLRIHWQDSRLQIIVQDNGCGFAPSDGAAGQDGLANMQRRLEKIGGHFECSSRVNVGTTYLITLPLPPT
jgi:signal transduction histidine kinase